MLKINLIANEVELATSRREHWESELEKLNKRYEDISNQLKLSRDIEQSWKETLNEIEMKSKSD